MITKIYHNEKNILNRASIYQFTRRILHFYVEVYTKS
ncbi:MAG: hypothetical protein K0Q63_851 [Paenibacillus sp.]|jgi:hypothetical protein|nr:hypothetical protein [Paenibacillus sp.]